MKLAIVTRYFPPDVLTGRETVIFNLWKQARIQDDVVLIAGWQNERPNLPNSCLAIDQSSSSRLLNYARFFVISAFYLHRLKPEVILSNAIEIGPASAPTAVIAYDFNFGSADYKRGKQRVRRGLLRMQFSQTDAVIAISQTTAKMLNEFGVSANKITAIKLGVDLERFCQKEMVVGRPDHFCVTYPARFVHGKGQHVAIEAVRQMKSDLGRKIKLILVGYVQNKEYLAWLRRESEGLPVEFHLDVEDIAPFYQRADLIIFPTIMEEGFGYTAAEALSCGKPVIFSDYLAIREATGGIGVAVPPGDANALASAIEKLVEDDQERQMLGQVGHTYALENYDWANVYKKYRDILEAMAN